MRKMLTVLAVLGMCTVAVNAQNLAQVPAGYDFTTRDTPGAGFLYLENTLGSSFWAQGSANANGSYPGDDIHITSPTGLWSMTGFHFEYFANLSAGVAGFLSARVEFYNNIGDYNSGGIGAPLQTYLVTGLGTGLGAATVTVPKVVLPADIWMAVQFIDGAGNVVPDLSTPNANMGLLIAGDGIQEIGNPSHDLLMSWFPDGSPRGLTYFGGYANGYLMANMLLGVQGKPIVPEPVSLTLLALGGLVAVRRRR